MQSKSTRGVQQEEVWDAADALIAAGERPTIERVRLKIGRGSPNTVSPMLDSWFSTLGERLSGQASSDQAQATPTSVLKAASELWRVAQGAAVEHAIAHIATERAAIEFEKIAVSEAKAILKQDQASLVQLETAVGETLALAKSQLIRSEEQVTNLQLMVLSRDNALAEREATLKKLTDQWEAERQVHVQQLNEHTETLRRTEDRATSNERRLLSEVDRARQELKASQGAVAESERKSEAIRQEGFAKEKALSVMLHHADVEIASVREKLLSAESCAIDLQARLEKQSETGIAAIAPSGRNSKTAVNRKPRTAVQRKNG